MEQFSVYGLASVIIKKLIVHLAKNDVPLKSLTFKTGQKKWDGGSSTYGLPS